MVISHAEQRLADVDIPETLLTYTAAHAHSIDTGERTTREVLSHIAAAGLSDLGAVGDDHGPLLHQAAVIERLAEVSLSTAFSLWCHRMCVEYLSCTGGIFADDVLTKFQAGEHVGSSAMAPAFKHAAGLGDLGLHIHRDMTGQLRLSGRLAWSSNVFSDAIVFAAAYGPPQNSTTQQTQKPVIVGFPVSSDGVMVGPDLDLLALRGTASTSLTLDHVPLHDSQILTQDFGAFVQRARPILSLLQASFCIGLTTASYRQMRTNLSGVNQVFQEDSSQLAQRLVTVKQQFVGLTEKLGTSNPPAPRDLLAMRLEAGVLARQMTRLETMTAGSAGFVTTSDVNRRYREATFIPLQAPSEAQLRWELSRAK